jgi:hypothetical protein
MADFGTPQAAPLHHLDLADLTHLRFPQDPWLPRSPHANSSSRRQASQPRSDPCPARLASWPALKATISADRSHDLNASMAITARADQQDNGATSVNIYDGRRQLPVPAQAPGCSHSAFSRSSAWPWRSWDAGYRRGLPGRVPAWPAPHPERGQDEGSEEHGDPDDQQVQQSLRGHAHDAEHDGCYHQQQERAIIRFSVSFG